MKSLTILIFSIAVLILIGCKKRERPLTWNSDWSAPLAHGELSIADLLPDSLLVSNPDSSLQLVFNSDLYTLDFNDLVALPDTNLLDTFSLPIVTPISFSPGQVFINEPEENVLDAEDAYLTYVKVKSGKLNYELESTVQGDVVYTYQIPSATDQYGQTFSKSVNVSAATSTTRSKISGSFDLDGYAIDLTGANGSSFNTILTSIDCKVSPSYGASVSVSNQDTIFISNTLESITVERAEGYFGQHTIATGWENSPIDGFSKFSSGSIGLDELSMMLTIENGIGADALIEIVGVSTKDNIGNQLYLNHAIVGTTQQLNRAQEVNGAFIPSKMIFNLDENNSNINNLISSLPTELGYNFNVNINPLGNISSYSDFLDIQSPLKLSLDASMPLNLVANNLTLVDTIEVQIPDTSMLNSMRLMLDMKNGFPLSADVSMAILDQNDKVVSYVFSPGNIPAATLEIDGKTTIYSESNHEIEINGKDMERLKAFGKVILTVNFNSDQSNAVNLYDYYRLIYDIKADANVTISIK